MTYVYKCCISDRTISKAIVKVDRIWGTPVALLSSLLTGVVDYGDYIMIYCARYIY